GARGQGPYLAGEPGPRGAADQGAARGRGRLAGRQGASGKAGQRPGQGATRPAAGQGRGAAARGPEEEGRGPLRRMSEPRTQRSGVSVAPAAYSAALRARLGRQALGRKGEERMARP